MSPSGGPPPAGHPWSPPTSPPYPPQVLRPPAERRRPSRALVLVAVGALLLGLAGGAAGALLLRDGGGPTNAGGGPTAAPVDPALPTSPPEQPGLEPPQGGGWPEEWPEFADADPVRPMTDLDGLGFSFEVPEGWDCTRTGRTSGFASYRCGVPQGDGVSIGGDLVVRVCARPCTEDRRRDMRELEEAWGLRWIRSGQFTTWAEAQNVENGRYGLIYLSYWRSRPEDAIDRQLVLRMTAPPGQEDVLRKVANSVREVTFTI
jgi:hypothetical protein